MPTVAKTDRSLAGALRSMDAGAVALGEALARRLAACRQRHKLDKRRKKKLKPGKPGRWFNWGNREVGTGVNVGLKTGGGTKGNDPGGA